MLILELFAGTRSIGKAFEKQGHKVFSVDWDKTFKDIDCYADISKLSASDVISMLGRRPDIIWASPDCTTYSVAGIGHHRKKGKNNELLPQTDYARFCDESNVHLIKLIKDLKPKAYFIENPRGGLRKMSFMQGLPRYTVTYCQYGDTRMKPTDIWTNVKNPNFKPPCKNGDSCHEHAPRGSQTGTQGIKGFRNRSVIPELLCDAIVGIAEKEYKDQSKPKQKVIKFKQVKMTNNKLQKMSRGV